MLKNLSFIGAIAGLLWLCSGICSGDEIKYDNGSMGAFAYYSWS